MGNMGLNCLDFRHLWVHMYYFTLSESGLAILHFLFLREVINELAVGGGKMGLRTRDCTAAQIRSV